MKKSKWLYGLFWLAERCLFKIEKWQLKYFGWGKDSNNKNFKQNSKIGLNMKIMIKPVAKMVGTIISFIIRFDPMFSFYNYVYERSPYLLVRFFVKYVRLPDKNHEWKIILLNNKKVKTRIQKSNIKTSQFAVSYQWHSRALNYIEAVLNDYFPKDIPWIDIGSNLGLRSLYALSVKRPVVFIEPNKELNQINEERCILNNFTRYTFIEKGISNKKGKLNFYIDQSSYMSTLENNGLKDKDISKVDVIEIDTLYNLFKQNIDKYQHACVKVDVEGHELKLFEGAKNFIKKLRPSFIVEVNIKDNHFKDFYEIVQRYNYEVYEIGFFGKNKYLRMIKNNTESSRLIENNDFLLIN